MLDGASQQLGLATTGGIISHTGVADLTLSGRVRIGPACGALYIRTSLITFNTNITHLGDAQSAIEGDIGLVVNIAIKEERRDFRAVGRR
jgi:hypothetical protein